MTHLIDGSTELTDSRLRILLDDSLNDRTDQSLEDLLYELAREAGEILGCDHVAISVLGVHGKVEHFVPVGMDPDLAARIGRLPSEHAMLDVPIMLRGRSAGGLYLAQPRGRNSFDELDERTAVSVAAAAANLVEKARTAAENARRDRWVTGASELARELVTGRHVSPMTLVAQRLLDIADADLVSVMAPGPGEGEIVVIAAAGVNDAKWDRQLLSSDSVLAAAVMGSGEAHAIAHLPEELLSDGMRATLDVDGTLLIPLTGTTDKHALLTISRGPGRQAFSTGELGMATMFAGQVALALELAELQAHRDQIAVIEERDRIARDLHDHIIQRLFAIGLSVQRAASHMSGRPSQQLQIAVDDIDDTIKQIRSSIYKLTVPIVAQSGSVRAQAVQIFQDLECALGFVPTLDVEGPVDFGIGEDVLDDCVAVLREALTNIARHANATYARVAIRVVDGAIVVEVEDNGCGIGEVTRRSGLSNLRTRAERRDGTLVVESGGSPGTRLIWRIPIGELSRRD
ncbi:MAG: histidine kinase [Jatrophihabitans sp.]